MNGRKLSLKNLFPIVLPLQKDDEGEAAMFAKVLELTLHDLEVAYLGPPIETGPLPAVFYFALSARDSLMLDPFNQPALFLHKHPLRIFAITLPGHEGSLVKEQAITYWAQHFKQGIDLLSPFVNKVCAVLHTLHKQHVLIEGKIGLMGLSRGAYLATLTAAHSTLCHHILGFAPLTRLQALQEFHDLSLPPSLDLSHHLDSLSSKTLRYYIGNRDLRVGTEAAFQLVTSLANYAHKHRKRDGIFELILVQSIGAQGHGTALDVFQQGSDWLARCLL